MMIDRGKPMKISATKSRFTFSGFKFDLASHELSSPSGERVDLTRSEFMLLTAFVRAPNRVLPRDFLLDAISRGGDAPVSRVVDVVVGRLRKKLHDNPRNPKIIRTVTGFGYLLTI